MSAESGGSGTPDGARARAGAAGGPRVSCIMIFRDAETFIDEAIGSVRSQSLAAHELLLVDDGSSDGGAALARRHAEADPARIRLLAHPGGVNRGMSASRNLALGVARGEHVAFLDADDVWERDFLARFVDVLDAHPQAAMACGRTRYWVEWGVNARDGTARSGGVSDGKAGRAGVRDRLDTVSPTPDDPCATFAPPALLTHLFHEPGAAPCLCSVMVRRETLIRAGGFEPRFRGLYEDQVFYAKLMLAAPVVVTDLCLARYRQHPRSACASSSAAETRAARRRFLLWTARHALRRVTLDPRLWRAWWLAWRRAGADVDPR